MEGGWGDKEGMGGHQEVILGVYNRLLAMGNY